MSLIEKFFAGDGLTKRAKLTAADTINVDPTVTLRAVLVEFEEAHAAKLSSWRPKRKGAAAAFRENRLDTYLEGFADDRARLEARRSNARAVVESVFTSLLHRDVTKISDEDLADAMGAHKRKRLPLADPGTATTANGQVSRARAYLGTVLAWAAGRGRFRKRGLHRKVKLGVVDMRDVYDPAVDDPLILGERERVLTHAEIRQVLPLLVYPAPPLLQSKMLGYDDVRPAALAFQFRQMSRIGEVLSASWRDIDWIEKVWKKRVKSRGSRRIVKQPLCNGAIVILKSLPSYPKRKEGGLIFENADKPVTHWQGFMTTLRDATGIQDIVSHDFRRTSATIARQLGVALDIISTGLGHKNPVAKHCASTSTATYARLGEFKLLSAAPLQAAFDQIDQAIDYLMRVEPEESDAAGDELEACEQPEPTIPRCDAVAGKPLNVVAPAEAPSVKGAACGGTTPHGAIDAEATSAQGRQPSFLKVRRRAGRRGPDDRRADGQGDPRCQELRRRV
jgi:integrase